MIDRFIAHLRRLDPEATPAEIADILWLAARMGDAGRDDGERPVFPEPEPKEKPPSEDSASASAKTGETAESRKPFATMYPRTAAGTGPGGAGGLGGQAIGSPGVPALPGRLELVRALRPLKRRVASRRFREVDIRATAERMAETKLPWPVTRPLPERWLDLILVEEVSPTMRIWRPVIRELLRLLRGAGVFRRVVRRRMALGAVEDGGNSQSSVTRLGVATAPERTLVLVVSDGVSAPWWNGEAARTLERWGRTAMTALVQMFPEHLWDRTGLGRAEKVRIRFPFPGASGRSVFAIRPFAGFDLDDLDDDVAKAKKTTSPAVLPVFPLEAAYVRDWAAALSGTGTFPPVGFLLEPSVGEGEIEADEAEGESPDLDARIRRFLSISSPTARRLCGYLAAIPLVFPIMRLVQGVMLPDSRQHHLAEVMLSGLVYRKTPRGEDRPDDEILYDFLEGARERLIGLNRIPDTLDVLSVVNEKLRAFLDEKTGRAVDFRALVGSPDGSGVSIGNDELGFARISAAVLGRMGGRYREIAEWVAGMAEIGGESVGGDGPESAEDRLEDALARLDELIGQYEVKQTVRTLINRLKVERLRGGEGALAPGHYLFTGNPGTGKTTVARLMGEMFRALGLLKKGHLVETGRSDLVAGYLGQTALKTREVLESSLDGVLFIDEAHQLVESDRDSFGKEALETLVAFMENQRDRLCIIAAGYPAPMRRFVAQNPGLASRFSGEILFENYGAGEMVEIFQLMAKRQKMTLSEELPEALHETFGRMAAGAGDTFGNGREVRKLLDAMLSRQADRLAALPETEITLEVMRTLTVNDMLAVVPPDTPEPGAEPKPVDIPEIPLPGTGQAIQIPVKIFGLDLEFAYIPPGDFMMGSPEDEPGRYGDESPRHLVRLTRGFYMQTTPVTQAQWEAVMGANPSHFKKAGPHAPVEQVSWEDVQKFIETLNSKADSYRFRLPTEAEWEYACRAGTETAFYSGPITEPSGHDPNLDKVGWFDENSEGTTHPVGQKEPNAWGLYDMHGNVWEWCSDWFDSKYYAKSPAEDPQGPEGGARRVYRGGAWARDARDCRAAYRDGYTPDYRYERLGFRLLAERRPRRCDAKGFFPWLPAGGLGGGSPPAFTNFLSNKMQFVVFSIPAGVSPDCRFPELGFWGIIWIQGIFPRQ